MVNTQRNRQLQKQATREHLIKTAMLVYMAQGFSVPTNIIAEEAGVAHGTIYVHFPTKEDLLLCALERFVGDMGEKLHGLSAANGDIEALLQAHIEIIEENERFYKNFIMQSSNLHLDAPSTLVALNATAAHHFEIAACRDIEAGKIKAMPIHMLYNTWLGLIHYYLQNSENFAPGGESVMGRYKDELVSSYMKLIEK